MLHMLSPAVLGLGKEVERSAAAAYEWAKQERQRFTEEGKEELSSRYARLLQYFNAHGFRG